MENTKTIKYQRRINNYTNYISSNKIQIKCKLYKKYKVLLDKESTTLKVILYLYYIYIDRFKSLHNSGRFFNNNN
jgi:hypothetical protein